MAPSFARSISFPLSPSRSKTTPPAPGYHARSISLPCRSHPILAHLHTHIRAVRSWAQDPTSVASGLAHVDALHAALAELLDLPEAQAALSAANDRLLDAFLRLADAHGSFQETVVALKQDVAEALAAIRRRDGARLASAVRSQRKAGKELARLAAAARDGARPSRLGLGGSAAEVEVTGLLMESAAVTAAASATLFNTVASMSASASAAACSCRKTAALVCLIKKTSASSEEEKETMALVERLEELEECIDELENGSDKVFRSLVQTRKRTKETCGGRVAMAPTTFARSISFPLSPATARSSSHHVRSISLPCRSHPLLSNLHATVTAVRSCLSNPPATALAHLHALHSALADLLLLPDTRAALIAASSTASSLLDAFLDLADAHGAFQEALLDLKRNAAEVQAALRRRDAARLSSAVRSQRQAEKDLSRLAASVRGAAKWPAQLPSSATVAEVEVSGVLADAMATVASASAAVFSAVETMSTLATTAAASTCSSSSSSKTLLISLLRKKNSKSSSSAAAVPDEEKEMVAFERMEKLEECMAEMESGSDKVFRTILHTRQPNQQEESMAPNFGRSISFPLSPAKPRSAPACHVRSISLPCRSHPLLSHLHAHIAAVRSCSPELTTALAHIHALHAALADLLLLPDPQDTLRRATSAADRLLDAFLLLADAHQGFHEALLDLTHHVADARSQRRVEKELSHLASTVSAAASATKYSSRLGLGATAEETDMAAALMDAAAASAAASAAVFTAVASMSSAAASSCNCKKTPAFAGFAKKASPETAEVALDRFEELEQCISESESSCHKVFRGILHTRRYIHLCFFLTIAALPS
uniref:DUF241 domain-containing protein n=1 Tax=Oryza punctata TaxID=4537 RepID=A0A0E0LFU0_ORYPU